MRQLRWQMRHHRGVPIDPFSEFDPYAGEPEPDFLPGHLLVAAPTLQDPNFARRVILVLDHGVHGALGVVIDRPGGVGVDQLLPQWHDLATPPAELFTGGPVARNSLIGLARLASRDHAVEGAPGYPVGWRLLVDDDRPVGLVDLGADPEPYEGSVVGARLFSGYAGWETGQLEDEIDEGSWYVVRAEARDPISADPEGLWRRVLRRQGGALALISGYPVDPTHN
jgi:putative transcriptional regulator